ncbi:MULTISPECIES: acyl-CoA dehydrogenase family protein [unclassified Brevibacterium]|uniref:acyl-CoA dehydrogenase family protein n=1 Tax=unclassified Brevibacterium TaxID=2614124 RepID=UPI001E2EFF9B|nr:MULTISPECIES: acyl-CoA dehydrogenase family protein [unclassified Brevibacterium]MCD1286066.1 acyl-CoA dehydrogenase [Brevibacterium sp. CCUG 69071]MDK8433418.1 acyl-CoA dehydrogenase family protein [Brevibacterium sp. H-BE7]
MIDPAVKSMSFNRYLAHIAELTSEVLIPGEEELVAAGAVPQRILNRMIDAGLFGISIPRKSGGLGWSMEEQVRLTLEFTRASLVYRSRFSTVIGLCSQGLIDHGTQEQQESLLPSMAAGETVTAFGLTEPEAGSDAQSLQTRAVRVGDEWLLNGSKRFITNAAWADLLFIFARTTEGISTFLVPRDTPGVSTRAADTMNGHAEAPVGEIELAEVRVPDSALVGGVEGNGMQMALRGINHARLHVAATAVGQAARMLEETAHHVNSRHQFGGSLAELGVVQDSLGACFAQLEAGRALTLEAAIAFDLGKVPRHRISAAKLFCTEMASQVADTCVQLLGGEGIVGRHPVPRMWRDVRALRIYEGSSPVHRRNLGRAMAKESRLHDRLPDSYRIDRR